MGSGGSKLPRTFAAGEEKIRSTIGAQHFDEIRGRCLSTGTLFQDPLFAAVDGSIYFSQSPNFPIEWLRPHEIARRYGLEPHFIFRGTNRFDIIQGEVGDCWVLAALASLAEHHELLAQVVPEGQTFDANWYAGVFHFRFYHFGQWVDVVVDDRLPCKRGGELFMLQSEYRNEFWGSLCEKAYAKLHGSYEALKAGFAADALMDFTAGIVETYYLRSSASLGVEPPPQHLYQILLQASQNGAVICAGIMGDWQTNQVLPNGLVSGHAYSISAVRTVDFGRQTLVLLRVKNPWGIVEWSGAWSDNSPQWIYLPDNVRRDLRHEIRNDGDFWIEFNDFFNNFDEIEICYLTPDSPEVPLHHWDVTVIHNAWISRATAGGRLLRSHDGLLACCGNCCGGMKSILSN